jgi:hypothetical protein
LPHFERDLDPTGICGVFETNMHSGSELLTFHFCRVAINANLQLPLAFWRPLKSTNIGVKMAKKVAKKVAKKTTKKRTRIEYTKADVRDLRAHSKARTPVKKIAKSMKRSEGSLRQKAVSLGIGLGHRR